MTQNKKTDKTDRLGTAISHEIPSDKFVYRHTGTDDAVKYLGRDDGAYLFRVNGERTMRLDPGDWPTYREFLEVSNRV